MIFAKADGRTPSSARPNGTEARRETREPGERARLPQHAPDGGYGNAGLGSGSAPFPRRPFAFMWYYIRRTPALHLAAILSTMGAASFASSSQYGMKMIVDAMNGGPGNMRSVWIAVSVFVGFLIGESLLWRAGSFFGFRAILRDKAALKLDLFDHLSGHSGRYFSNHLAGGLANRISSTGDSVQQILTTLIFTMAPVCADFMVAVALLSIIDWRLVTALAIFVVAVASILAMFGQRGKALHRAYADRSAEVGGELVDVVSNIWVVKAFSARARERQRFADLLGTEERTQRRSLMFVEGTRIFHDMSLWAMAAGLLGWTVHLWTLGRITSGDVVVTSALAFRILHGSRDFAFAIVNSTQFVARISDTIHVIGERHDVVDLPGTTRLVPHGGSITFENAGFGHADGRVVFRNFNLFVPAGQRVGLVGPSGAGKSTLISLVQRLADLQEGRLLIDDQEVSHMAQEELRAAIAVVPQEISLFHRSVMENIRYARPEATDEEVVAAAVAARCDGFIRELPEGYNTQVGERGTKLSGGQRQRLGIARAILKDAPIILLDEATSALDTQSEAEIQQALDNAMRGRTVLAIAHRLSTVADFDRIVVMQDGHVVEDGAPAELRRHHGLFDKMWRMQADSLERQVG